MPARRRGSRCGVGSPPRTAPRRSGSRRPRQGGSHRGSTSSRALIGRSSSRPTRCHQARNDSAGGSGRSRAWVQREPGHGSQASARRPPGIPRPRPNRPTSAGERALPAHPAGIAPSPTTPRAWRRPRPWARCRPGASRRPWCAGAPGCRGCRSHRADVGAGPAQGRGVGQRVDLRVRADALEQRVEDGADRARVDRAVGVATDPLVDRADVQAGRAADAAQRLPARPRRPGPGCGRCRAAPRAPPAARRRG